jgi:cellobiose-specific phosphotransferase system component IIA
MNKSDALHAKLEAAQRELEETMVAEAGEEEEQKWEADEARRQELEMLDAEVDEASKKMKVVHTWRLELMAAEAEAEALSTWGTQEASGKSVTLMMPLLC